MKAHYNKYGKMFSRVTSYSEKTKGLDWKKEQKRQRRKKLRLAKTTERNRARRAE